MNHWFEKSISASNLRLEAEITKDDTRNPISSFD